MTINTVISSDMNHKPRVEKVTYGFITCQ